MGVCGQNKDKNLSWQFVNEPTISRDEIFEKYAKLLDFLNTGFNVQKNQDFNQIIRYVSRDYLLRWHNPQSTLLVLIYIGTAKSPEGPKLLRAFHFVFSHKIKSELSSSEIAFIPSFQLQSLIHLALNLICSLDVGLP